MPELPDLQVFSRNLKKLIAGKNVKNVVIAAPKNVDPGEKEISVLEKQSVKDVYRDGKELFIEFSKGDILALHMMLRGELHFSEKAVKQKYPVIEVHFEDGSSLVQADFRGMAKAKLNPEKKPGVDALSKELNFEFLKGRLQKTRTNIKTILMDQKIIGGIGNAYADEILWEAGIAPQSAGNKIPENKIKDLVRSIKSVLEDAEKNILKSHPDIIAGEFRDFLNIHNSKLKKSPTGGEIKVEEKGGRKTYFTEEQELFL